MMSGSDIAFLILSYKGRGGAALSRPCAAVKREGGA